MDIALKQRLVGAVVLIALGVVVLPMLLSGRPDEAGQEAQTIELPPQPADLDFQTRRFPVRDTADRPQPDTAVTTANALPSLPQPGAAAADTPAAEGPGPVAQVEVQPREFQDALEGAGEEAPQEPATVEAPATGAGDSAAPAAALEVAPAAVAAQDPRPTGSGRYVVQVASFGSTANAKRLAETLRSEGYSVLSDTVQSDVGTLHRVRVGPYPSEAEANGAANRLRQQMADVQPRIVDLQPEQAAAVTAPSDPMVRWVVQVGSFSSADNADRLVQQLRELQLSAYREAVASGGATIHRVRAGPYVERDEALRVDALILERLGLDGVVMSAD